MFSAEVIRSGVGNLLRVNMGLRPGESVLLVNDVPGANDWTLAYCRVADIVKRSLMVKRMYEICLEEFKENRVEYLTYPCLGLHGSEPPQGVADRLRSDVILAITSYSLSHTQARESATQKGCRIASMPGLEYEMLRDDGPMAADYEAIGEETRRLAAMLTAAQKARVTTRLGTDLSFSLRGREGGADTGIMAQRGEWGNLPGGEAYIAPVEGTAEGRLVVPAGWFAGLERDMELEFRKGYVTSLKGGNQVGEEFRTLLSFGDESLKHRRNCAELGIGTNPKAKRPDNTLESEKIKGTIHVAVGDSSHMGGLTESDLHEDFVIPEPTLYLDGRVVMEEGLYDSAV